MKFYPKVSIVIPVYNGENYVKEAIDSALEQTYKNIEILVVNDGSGDNTEKIVKSYGNKVKYFSKENGGTSTALNVAIKHMTGEYFSWLSHDDMYYPKKIQRQIEELEKLENKNTIMMTDLDGIDENYQKIYQTSYMDHILEYPEREKSFLHPIIYNQTHGCTLLIPKICFDTEGLFDEKELVAQDFELFYRVFKVYPHKLIPEILVTARDSSNRQGRRSKTKGSVEYSRLFIKMIEEFTENDFKLLAPSKATFYADMKNFFECAGYKDAYDYVCEKTFINLQISSNDLIGNKFNGHDLHLYLRDMGIDSKQIVLNKQSSDDSTCMYNFNMNDATKRLIATKTFADADLIHMHLIHNIIDLNYLPLISKLKPVILSIHDPFFLGGHCVHHFDCEKWQTHCGDCQYIDKIFPLEFDYSALNFELKKSAIQNSNITAIAASKWIINKMKKSKIWENKTIYHLPFGINQDIFKPADKIEIRKKLGLPENDIIIMFRSDNGPFKGNDIIKKALNFLKVHKPITIITVSEKNYYDEFKEKFNIKEYGWVSDDEFLSNLYQASDIFLMPSRQETFGLMAIEAMSCGKLVLGLECDGSSVSEIINSPKCGLAVPEAEYSKELNRIINSLNELEDRGQKSLVYAQNNYSKSLYLKNIIDIYNKTMEAHNLDNDSKFIVEQLKKYSPELSSLKQSERIIFKNPNFLIKQYRKLPYFFRKKVKNTAHRVYKSVKGSKS